MVEPVQALLKQCGLKISRQMIITILTDIDKAVSWFAVSGISTRPPGRSWDSILREQNRKANWGTVPFLFCCLVRGCLQEGANTEIIKEGRKALVAHQDSLSESDSKGENLDRPKRKIEKKKEKIKNVENGSKKEDKKDSCLKDGDEVGQLYLVLKEFVDLDLSDDELNKEGKEELEEEAAKYGEEGWDRLEPRPLPHNPSYNPIPSAPPVLQKRAPPASSTTYAQPSMPREGCHFINQNTWSRLASAFPVMIDPATQQRR